MDYRIVILIASIIAAAGCLVLPRWAGALGMLDHPGGHKNHAAPVPLVGGLAVSFAALCMSLLTIPGMLNKWPFLLAAAMLIAIGALDDRLGVRPLTRFAVQIGACLVMIFGAGVELRSVGNLTGLGSIGMWVFTVPATVFAVVGVINSINMIDGEDGLAGTVSLIALAWYGCMASQSGAYNLALGAVILCGALAGFLAFNLRLPWRPRATVFLGDAGSTLLGFVLAWMAIVLTQGPADIPPICALWIILLPLADAVSVIVRPSRLRNTSPTSKSSKYRPRHSFGARSDDPGGAADAAGTVAVASVSFEVSFEVSCMPRDRTTNRWPG